MTKLSIACSGQSAGERIRWPDNEKLQHSLTMVFGKLFNSFSFVFLGEKMEITALP